MKLVPHPSEWVARFVCQIRSSSSSPSSSSSRHPPPDSNNRYKLQITSQLKLQKPSVSRPVPASSGSKLPKCPALYLPAQAPDSVSRPIPTSSGSRLPQCSALYPPARAPNSFSVPPCTRQLRLQTPSVSRPIPALGSRLPLCLRVGIAQSKVFFAVCCFLLVVCYLAFADR